MRANHCPGWAAAQQPPVGSPGAKERVGTWPRGETGRPAQHADVNLFSSVAYAIGLQRPEIITSETSYLSLQKRSLVFRPHLPSSSERETR